MLDALAKQLDVFAAQIDAMRAIVAACQNEHDAMLTLLEARGGVAPESGECEHPEDQRTSASNIGEPPAFFCAKCRKVVSA